VERVAVPLREAREALQFDERVLEVLSVRIDDRRPYDVPDAVEEHEIRVH
jgi:hypothetical protein